MVFSTISISVLLFVLYTFMEISWGINVSLVFSLVNNAVVLLSVLIVLLVTILIMLNLNV